MFKRTNKFWKGLALVLALCMISTVAYAAGEPQTATVTLGTKSYNPETQTVTIAGTIDVPGNDVTILAVRGGAAYSALTDVWTEEMLPSKVVYIDQETSDATTGAFSFSFKPRADVIGGVISVFVGGEDVANVAPWSTEAKMAAPTLVLPNVWYEGTNTLDIELKDGDAPFANAEAWEGAINAVTVVPAEDGLTWGLNAEKTHLVLSGFETAGENITSITITTNDNAFEDATCGAIAQAKHDLGGNVLSVEEGYFAVAGGKAAITVETNDGEWKAALGSSVYVGDAPEAATGVSLDGNTLSVPVDIADRLEQTETVTITVKQDYYKNETVNVTVVAPTKAAADAAEIEWEYSATTDDAGENTAAAKAADSEATEEERKTRYGAAIVTLPTPETGYKYSWTAVSTDEGAATIEIADNAEYVTLDRPNYVEAPTAETPQSYTYTLTLTVSDVDESNGTYVAVPKTFEAITVSRVGMRGVPVAAAPSFGGNAQQSAAIAADATATLTGATGDIALTWDSEAGSFKGENVAPGEYTITVVRRGFLVGSSTITVGADGQITGTMPEMIAGDSNGDGTIDISDVAAAVTVWDSNTTYADLNADGVVDISDVAIIVSNWDATGVGTGSLE